ncbi:MAG: hypothetical protein ACFKPT_09310 [Gloeotrichia echinulata GP01]
MALIVKIVKKVIKKETSKHQDDLPIVSTTNNHPIERFVENVATWEDERPTEENINNIYTSRYASVLSKEDAELERKLRELKFKQELIKDWISFLVRDVIVYSATTIFIFAVAGFYLFTLITRN